MSLQSNTFKYIGEGNAHIVLEIVNTDKVLRLFKEDREFHRRGIQLSINFVNTVMMPLLSKTVDKYDLIDISEEKLNLLLAYLESLRPKERMSSLKISNYAVVATNLLILGSKFDSFCIEIKPKEGYMSGRFKEFSKCYYCMKQLLKLRMKQIQAVSMYCPLDLFSGDKKRMKHALLNLIENPQNNFKLFKNDEIIYSDKHNVQDFNALVSNIAPFKKTKSHLLDFIIEVLLRGSIENEIKLSATDEQIPQVKRNHCLDSNNLTKDCFLYNLLCIQKLSENVNIDSENINVNGDIDYVSSILDQVENFDLDVNCKVNEVFTSINFKSLGLIAAVAKDCSIMLSFSLSPVEGYPFILIEDKKISYRLAVTDMEPKPERSLIKRKKTEEKLISLYKEYHKME